ncbi:MAG TPA: acetyl-CoA carboxylase biotin carboxyl carrier protein [Terracidiphilus sp.]|nr:acetyl-CoA carboxylase biotin carboxyl carrier protein [Terracidiphilus sp.]
MKPEEIQELKELIEFLKAYQVAEFDLDRGDTKIRLKFAGAEPAASPAMPDLARLLAAAPGLAQSAAPHASASQAHAAPAAPAADPDSGLHIVKSPIVGTYYGSPSPGAAPFVSTGDRVEKGQVICIVEAMKLMNEIESDASGEVVKAFVSNGQPVEFGQPLFSIRVS